MDIKSLITIEELPTVGSTNPEQEYLLLQTPEKTGKMPLSNLPSEASKIGFDNKGTNLSSNTVQAAITELDSSLIDIYVGDDGKLHKVKGGADSVLPFNGEPKIYNGRKQWSGSVQVSSGNPSVTLTDSINVGSGKTIDGVYIRNAGIVAPALNNPGSNNNGVISISHSYNSETGIVSVNIAVTWYTSTCKITDIDCSYTIVYH